MTLGLADGVRVEVERDALVVGIAMDAVHRVAAHLSETDEAELHQGSLLTASAGSPWSRI